MAKTTKKKQQSRSDESAPSFKQGYARAVELLHACATQDGFLASPTDRSNYRRVWARDGVILGLAALLTEDAELVETTRRTLETLADHQGPHGEIPSNVDSRTSRVSYGGTTGRVDADLWFIIGCGEYWMATDDDAFIKRMLPVLEKVRFLLGAWEFNNRGLIYVPQTGDWADEYVHNGYVLHDQLLYLQAHRTICAIHRRRHASQDHRLIQKASRLKHLIRASYWFQTGDQKPDDLYHEVLYEKGRKVAGHSNARYWLPFFAPHGYGYRFDALANVLASLLDVADDNQRAEVDDYIESEVVDHRLRLLPAFHPIITPKDVDWSELQTAFSYTFRNNPYEYQNGGLWPMITGFYVADLARRGRKKQARAYLRDLHRANAMEMNGRPWGFPECLNGKEHKAGGTYKQGWSAAGAVIGHHVLEGKELLRIRHMR